MPSAVQFYSALGLDLVDGGADAPHTEFSSGASACCLTPRRSYSASILSGRGRPVVTTGLDCSNARLNSHSAGGAGSDPVAGVVHEPWDAFWGQRYAVVSDPDDNTIDLFAA